MDSDYPSHPEMTSTVEKVFRRSLWTPDQIEASSIEPDDTLETYRNRLFEAFPGNEEHALVDGATTISVVVPVASTLLRDSFVQTEGATTNYFDIERSREAAQFKKVVLTPAYKTTAHNNLNNAISALHTAGNRTVAQFRAEAVKDILGESERDLPLNFRAKTKLAKLHRSLAGITPEEARHAAEKHFAQECTMDSLGLTTVIEQIGTIRDAIAGGSYPPDELHMAYFQSAEMLMVNMFPPNIQTNIMLLALSDFKP